MGIMNDKEYSEWIGGIARRYKQSQIKTCLHRDEGELRCGRGATAVNVETLKCCWSLV